MYKTVKYMELDLDGDYILVDVRSKGEYDKFTIPGALNIPIFDDEERRIIGTVYKNESVEKAKKLGIQMVSAKLLALYEKFSALRSGHRSIVIFCERGGMRSSSLWALFNSIGLKTVKLEGGYKGYRAAVNEHLPRLVEDTTFVVLHGHTGTGKTQLLGMLEQKGFDVLDLEKMANHRGSLLGEIGLPQKPVSQKSFESEIFDKLRRRKSKDVFIEAESSKIGSLSVPKHLHNKMRTGRHILVEGSLDIRAKRIVEEYITGEDSRDKLLEAVGQLEKFIGIKKTEKLKQLVEQGAYQEAAEILMLEHYDPLYQKGQRQYEYLLRVNSDQIHTAAEALQKSFHQLIHGI
jgi:tRNA 2-selenouridine synthase